MLHLLRPLPTGVRARCQGLAIEVFMIALATGTPPAIIECREHKPARRSRQREVGVSKVPVGGHQRPAVRRTGFMEYLAGMLLHSGLMFAERITLAHFSVSSTMNLPKSVGEPVSTVPPRSASRAFIVVGE